MPVELVSEFEAHGRLVDYGEHETIVDFADDTSDVRFVVSGRVRVIMRTEGGKEMILGEVKDGGFFGELAAIDGEGRSANVTTLTNTRVVSVSGDVFHNALQAYPAFALCIMQVLSLRIRQLNQRLSEHSFLDAKHRLYNELLGISRKRSGHDGQRIISPPPIQQDIADKIGCRREVVSREIAKLKTQNLVEQSRGGLILPEPYKLSALISEAWER